MKKWIRKWLGVDHLITREQIIQIIRDEYLGAQDDSIGNILSWKVNELLYNERLMGDIIERINKLQLTR